MSTTDAAADLKQAIELEGQNQADLIRLGAELQHHEAQAAELAAQAKAEGCNTLDELRALFTTGNAENLRAVAEFKNTVSARRTKISEIRDQLNRLNNAPSARG
ncbi:hypothetical protein RBE51_19450 [Pseudomonas taiwanensis]|uniref:hypothetical protein n=1 Tax=Pseudomonas taiwanensis TaxID=470150 RepID=UPI0028DE0154|nr:hypothetical protein [Pseudomonas taiwanensis]MDT8924967.1 hypothetical protein [Pseudomonas taiwanensis]